MYVDLKLETQTTFATRGRTFFLFRALMKTKVEIIKFVQFASCLFSGLKATKGKIFMKRGIKSNLSTVSKTIKACLKLWNFNHEFNSSRLTFNVCTSELKSIIDRERSSNKLSKFCTKHSRIATQMALKMEFRTNYREWDLKY